MPETAITAIIATYGPLGLGWGLAWYFVRQNIALQTKVMEAFLADTAAKIELKNALQSLSDIIKGKH